MTSRLIMRTLPILAVWMLLGVNDTIVPLGARLPLAASDIGQPTSLRGFHRDGQTFLTWKEVLEAFPADVSYPEYAQALTRNAHLKYRLYRHTAPIQTANLAEARLVAEVGIGSAFNLRLHGMEAKAAPGRIKRFVVDEGHGGWGTTGELSSQTGLHVFTAQPGERGHFFYAITLVIRGVENRQITAANSLSAPVSEQYSAAWKPVLQNDPRTDRFSYHTDPGVQHIFTRWEAEPLHSVNSSPANYMVVIFPKSRTPYKVDLSLHCWGASLVSCVPWVYYPDGMFVTSTDFPPQSWWTGWNTDFCRNGCGTGTCAGPNRYYTMKRLLSFLDWVKTQWPVDETRVMCSGNSMGGSGGKMFCLRHGEMFTYVNSWVGIGIPRKSPVFANEYEALFGPATQSLLSENGVNTWDDLDMAQWLRANLKKETPFITFSNGKNDGGIGWPQAVEFYRALRDTKRAFTFRWGQNGHGERAIDMGMNGLGDNAGLDRIDFQRNKALPAFANFTLDANPGNGEPGDGAAEGAVNAYQRWDPKTIVDAPGRFEIELWLLRDAPAPTGTMDVTLRNVQGLMLRPGQTFTWKVLERSAVIRTGSGVADAVGLVTATAVELKRDTRRRLVVDVGREQGSAEPRLEAPPPPSRPTAAGPAEVGPAGEGPIPSASRARTAHGCERLPPPEGVPVVRVVAAQSARLPDIVASAQPWTTILLEDGTYRIGAQQLTFRQPGVTLRSRSGNRDAVVLDGDRYTTRFMIGVQASNVTIADLTIQEVYHHPIHVSGGGDHALLYNLHLIDGRQQFIKVNPGSDGRMNDQGVLACSLLELTDTGRAYLQANPTPGFPCYTGGIVAHQARDWVVRDNTFRGIYCDKGLAQHAVHFWKTSRDIVVERNRIINCARGIGFGLGPDGPHRRYPDAAALGTPAQVGHIGGIIRNNTIWSNLGRSFDTGIGLEQAHGAKVYHNTIYANGGFSSIDVRFASSNPQVKNNLASIPMTVRDAGQPSADRNLESATAEMFVDAARGDLHLAAGARRAIDQGVDLRADTPFDIDGESRNAAPDIGAHEYGRRSLRVPDPIQVYGRPPS